jgi:protein-tyrosine phosphatase
MSLIIEGLYLGDVSDSGNELLLKKLKINRILIVGQELAPKFKENYKYLKIEAIETPNYEIKDYFEQTSDFIDDALAKKENVLVHCAVGMNRSATIVIAYLMKKYQMNLEETLEFVKDKRPIVKPSYHNLNQLR